MILKYKSREISAIVTIKVEEKDIENNLEFSSVHNIQ